MLFFFYYFAGRQNTCADIADSRVCGRPNLCVRSNVNMKHRKSHRIIVVCACAYLQLLHHHDDDDHHHHYHHHQSVSSNDITIAASPAFVMRACSVVLCVKMWRLGTKTIHYTLFLVQVCVCICIWMKTLTHARRNRQARAKAMFFFCNSSSP